MTPDELIALVQLANALGVRLDSRKSNAQALQACTIRARELNDTLYAVGKVLLEAERERICPLCKC